MGEQEAGGVTSRCPLVGKTISGHALKPYLLSRYNSLRRINNVSFRKRRIVPPNPETKARLMMSLYESERVLPVGVLDVPQ